MGPLPNNYITIETMQKPITRSKRTIYRALHMKGNLLMLGFTSNPTHRRCLGEKLNQPHMSNVIMRLWLTYNIVTRTLFYGNR
jgi:hypothetical protein